MIYIVYIHQRLLFFGSCGAFTGALAQLLVICALCGRFDLEDGGEYGRTGIDGGGSNGGGSNDIVAKPPWILVYLPFILLLGCPLACYLTCALHLPPPRHFLPHEAPPQSPPADTSRRAAKVIGGSSAML